MKVCRCHYSRLNPFEGQPYTNNNCMQVLTIATSEETLLRCTDVVVFVDVTGFEITSGRAVLQSLLPSTVLLGCKNATEHATDAWHRQRQSSQKIRTRINKKSMNRIKNNNKNNTRNVQHVRCWLSKGAQSRKAKKKKNTKLLADDNTTRAKRSSHTKAVIQKPNVNELISAGEMQQHKYMWIWTTLLRVHNNSKSYQQEKNMPHVYFWPALLCIRSLTKLAKGEN